MCAITSLIVQDYFSGEICKIYVDGISHYFNLLEGKIVDLTSIQFNNDIDYNNYQVIDREEMLNEDTKNRYNSLKKKLTKYIKDETSKIYLERFANPSEIAKTVYFLASEEASYINGEIVTIDGGY